jgi:ribokinase
MTESPSRPPRTPEPAEGGDPPGQEDAGRTPRTEEPAEGGDVDEEPGADPENRITGV